MSALRLAARRLPRASKIVPALDSPVQRRLATTSSVKTPVRQADCIPGLELTVS